MCPASCSSALTGLRGTSLGRTTSHAAARKHVKTVRPRSGQSVPGEFSGESGLAAPSPHTPSSGEELEEQAREQPEDQPGAKAAQRGRQRDTAPSQAGEQVDDDRQARQERGAEGEHDRPAPHRASAQVDVARGALRELHLCVQRAEEGLRRAPDLAQALAVEPIRRVTERRRRSRARRGDRQRRSAAADERRVLVEAEGERKVDQLSERGDSPGLAPALLQDPGRSRAHERDRGRSRPLAGDLDPRRAVAGDGVQVDHGHDAVAPGAAAREAVRSERSEEPAVGREKDDRVIGARRQGRRGRGRVGARELEERCGARRVVVGARPRPGVVPVRHDHDRVTRLAGAPRDHVLQVDAAATGYFHVKPVRLSL